MTDAEKKIAEIREALEKATPGPWKWIDPGGRELKKLVGEWEIMNFGVSAPYSEIAGQEPDDADAHLIANAPEWLRFLLDELELVNRERDKLIDGLRTVMKFAAEDGIHWKLDRCYTTARDTLKEIGVTASD